MASRESRRPSRRTAASASDVVSDAERRDNGAQDGDLQPADRRRSAAGDPDAPDGHRVGDKRKASEAAANGDTRTEASVNLQQVEDNPPPGAPAPWHVVSCICWPSNSACTCLKLRPPSHPVWHRFWQAAKCRRERAPDAGATHPDVHRGQGRAFSAATASPRDHRRAPGHRLGRRRRR